jgi:chromosome segregation ATPase
LPRADRIGAEGADIAADSYGNPIRELADRLAEEAARAAEYRVRLELTEQAQSSLEEELAEERRRREEAERERDELLRRVGELEVPSEATGFAESAEGAPYGTSRQEAEDSLQSRSSWWRRFFGLE